MHSRAFHVSPFPSPAASSRLSQCHLPVIPSQALGSHETVITQEQSAAQKAGRGPHASFPVGSGGKLKT